jgi:hypothetical protein
MAMRSRLFHVVGVLALFACVALIVLWAASYVGRMQREIVLPGGMSLSAYGRGSNLRLTATRWGVESKEWWRARPGTAPMSVTGQTVTIAGATLYATKLSVDFGTSDWHGVRIHQGAVSGTPATTSVGVMSTPLVPYRSVSVPWFYPILILGPVAVGWCLIVASRTRRRRGGLCAVCGYDLRATPERCPECGSAAATTGRSPGGA